jgi:hypothetical protein
MSEPDFVSGIAYPIDKDTGLEYAEYIGRVLSQTSATPGFWFTNVDIGSSQRWGMAFKALPIGELVHLKVFRQGGGIVGRVET